MILESTKKDVVERYLALTEKTSMRQFAQQNNVVHSTLCKWVRAYRDSNSGTEISQPKKLIDITEAVKQPKPIEEKRHLVPVIIQIGKDFESNQLTEIIRSLSNL